MWVIYKNILVVLCKQFHFVNAQTCHFYNKAHNRCVRITIKMLTCHLFYCNFFYFCVCFVGHTIGINMSMWCDMSVALRWYLYFFNIMKEPFHAFMMRWVVINGALLGLYIGLKKSFLVPLTFTWLFNWYL